MAPGDVLFTAAGSIGLTYLVGPADEPACYAGYLARFRPNASVLPEFVSYWAESCDFLVQANANKVSSTIDNLSASRLRGMKMPVPPISTQRRVLDYLDPETARIDALMNRKLSFIDLLLEKRTALIAHAVTKGLDQNAELKDSGVSWFGYIPSHWPVVKLGLFARVMNGSTPSRSDPGYWLNGTIPWMSSGKVNEDRVNEPSELISGRALAECSINMVPAGSVLIGLVGQGRTRGTVALLEIDATINQNVAAIILGRQLDSRYLQYQLCHMYRPIREYGRGGNQAALNCELVAELCLPLPPRDEQANIARYLDAETAVIDAFIEKTRSSVDLLREYRIALISAAVTGQIGIPGTETSEDVA